MTALCIVAVSVLGLAAGLELAYVVDAESKEERAWAVERVVLLAFAIVCIMVER